MGAGAEPHPSGHSPVSWRVVGIPAFVFVFGLALSLGAWSSIRKDAEERTRELFNARALETQSAMVNRLRLYAGFLRGGRGLFDASSVVSREEWRAFVESLQPEEEIPGLLAIGFGEVIDAEDASAREAELRRNLFPDFAIRPWGERARYVPDIYVMPETEENLRLIGYDPLSNPERAEAIAIADATNDVAMTGAVNVRAESGGIATPGFIMYLPVVGHSPGTDDRIIGYIFGRFSFDGVMSDIAQSVEDEIDIHIYDSDPAHIGPDSLVYDYDLSGHDPPGADFAPRYRKEYSAELFGRTWTIVFDSLPKLEGTANNDALATYALVEGFILSLFAAAFAYILLTSRNRALALALGMTAQLAQSKADLEKKYGEAERLTDDLAKFKLAADSANDQIVITDAHGTVLYANKATETITGFSTAEIIGKKVGSRELWGGIMPREFYAGLWRTIKDEKKVFRGVIKNRRKSGEEYYAYGTISPILDEKGDVAFFVAIEHDATEERRIDQAKTEFVSLASHQLRTPLSAINWFTEMLISGDAGDLSPEQKKYVTEVYSSSRRMADLIDALLDVSRIDLGTFVAEPSDVKVCDIASGVLTDLRGLIEKKRIAVENGCPDDTAPVVADPKHLTMIIQNLLSNAVKYTPEGGRVGLRTALLKAGEMWGGRAAEADSLAISVADSGYGIPNSAKDKVFTKLYRADNVRVLETDGTGLGLYIVKAITEHSGGEIWFSSEEGKGTEFFVLLPLEGMRRTGAPEDAKSS